MIRAALFGLACFASAHEHTDGHAHDLALHASGTTNPSKLHWKYMETLEERLGMPLLMTYRAVGSSTGQKEFLARASDFGASEVALSAEQQATYNEPHLHIPHVIGAISIFHNVPSDEAGDALNITPEVLAKIFQRDIKTWDHAEIKALNPKLNVPAGQKIKVVHRVKGSSSTSLTTTYLKTAAPDVWKLDVGKTITWPEDTFSAEGSGGISSFISSTLYSIGYIDADHGHTLGLSEIALQNKDGVYLTSKQAILGEAATYAVTPATSEGSWADVSLVNQAGPKTWPMVTFSYMLVPKNLTRY
jgi:phosphate ABC transporter phosphate-binding protein